MSFLRRNNYFPVHTGLYGPPLAGFAFLGLRFSSLLMNGGPNRPANLQACLKINP